MRRALQRRWRRSLAGFALLYALGHAPAAPAARIDVGVGGCTLVDAITAANTDGMAGGCTAGNGPDTISLPAGSTQRLASVNNASYGDNGLPLVTSTIVIDGNGSTIERPLDASAEFRIVAIGSTGDLSLKESTITGGSTAGDGGAIHNTGTLTLTNSTVLSNSAAGDGGGLFNRGMAALVNSTVAGNLAASGGATSNIGTLTLTNSTVSGNAAAVSGGGLRNAGNLSMTSSTVYFNQGGSYGGGIFNGASATARLVQTLVSGNTSPEGPEVYNFTTDGSGTVYAGSFNLFGFYGSDGLAGFAAGPTDIVPIGTMDTILDPVLGDNGGPTKTHALIPDSPAIDAVPAASCATPGDQRGASRPQDGDANAPADCDIGAFEVGLLPPAAPLPDASPADRNPRVRCRRKRCDISIRCDAVQDSVDTCDIRVAVFVRGSASRIDGDGEAGARRRTRFAAGAANIAPGTAANISLTLSKRGRRIVQTSQSRRLRGVMEIRTAVDAVETVSVRIRLRR